MYIFPAPKIVSLLVSADIDVKPPPPMVSRFCFLGFDNGVDDDGTEEDKAAARLDGPSSIYHN